MAEFRTKLITLAGIATMFAGMAHGQIVGCAASSNAVFLAAEGTTEQISDIGITCTASATAATMNLTVYLSPAISITSATLTGTTAGVTTTVSEAIAGKGSLAGGVITAPVNGVVSGSQITFNGIAFAAAAPVSLVISNIKVNASQIATSTGAPTAVQATVFVGGANVPPAALAPVSVGFATNGLAGVLTRKGTDLTSTSVSDLSICTGSTAFDKTKPAFQVEFTEGFATAFKLQGSSATNATVGSQITNNTYTGYGVTNGAATNTATSSTRVQITLNNIPGGTNVYVPLLVSSVNAGVTSTMTLVNSAAGGTSLATGSTANGAPGGSDNGHAGDASAAQLTVSNGTATAIYEETLQNSGASELYDVPVYLQVGGAVIQSPAGNVTASVSFAPIGSTTNVPNFVAGSSTVTKNGPKFNACNTTLLFPFVTNQLGFDTGIAISNTSSDFLKSATSSNAANQGGTCSLTFFGNTAPAAAVVTPTVATGTSYAAAASTLAPGFQGYMIANCNFLYGHGFSYVVYNLTQNNGAAMGYLALVINSDRKEPGTDAGISNTNPESGGN